MPSPFSGMDPFIESESWADFHHAMIGAIRHLLVPSVRPRYVVKAEQRVYLEYELDDTTARVIVPDLLVGDKLPQPSRARAGTTMVVEPITPLPMPEVVRERYLTIRKTEDFEIVTIIELLSLANKQAGSDDRSAYLAKRDEELKSSVHLVELDLLRGGRRLPSVETLPLADYFAIISRNGERPQATGYPWKLDQRMPTIPIPLATGDQDVALDLQAAFDYVYDDVGYDYSLKYSRDVEPVLSPEDEAWVKDILQSRSSVTA